MRDIMADYVKLPELEEYKEWFKDHFDLYRDEILIWTHTGDNWMMDKVLPEFREKLKAAGVDDIVSAVQTQLDEWKGANNK